MTQSNIVQFSAALSKKRLDEERKIEDQVHALIAEGISPRQQEGLWESYLERQEAKRQAKLQEAITAPETLTETCINQRLRFARRDAWRTADRLTEFRRAKLDWFSALSLAQERKVVGADAYPTLKAKGVPREQFCEHERLTRVKLHDEWREAQTAQLLTPAPDQLAVAWKQARLKAGDDRGFTDIDPLRVKCAIAADIEWLKTHPFRKDRPAKARKNQS
jgi:hypothetical protein